MLSLKLYVGYNLFTAALFFLLNSTVVSQALSDWDATHPSDKPVAHDPLARVMAPVYYQVRSSRGEGIPAAPGKASLGPIHTRSAAALHQCRALLPAPTRERA